MEQSLREAIASPDDREVVARAFEAVGERCPPAFADMARVGAFHIRAGVENPRECLAALLDGLYGE